MQNMDKLDKTIMEALSKQANGIQGSLGLKNNVMANISMQKKERAGMKKINIKRVIVIAAALTVLTSAAVFAGSRMLGGMVSVSSALDETKDYGKLQGLVDDLGYTVTAGFPEQFESGYKFSAAVPGEGWEEDETGAAGEKYKELRVGYMQEQTGKEINVNISKTTQESAVDSDKTTEYEGITLYYSEDHYLFVGDESDITEADRLAEAEGKLYISYGGDAVPEPQRNIYESVSWYVNGTYHGISAFDSNLGADELFELAKDVIDYK